MVKICSDISVELKALTYLSGLDAKIIPSNPPRDVPIILTSFKFNSANKKEYPEYKKVVDIKTIF